MITTVNKEQCTITMVTLCSDILLPRLQCGLIHHYHGYTVLMYSHCGYTVVMYTHHGYTVVMQSPWLHCVVMYSHHGYTV